MTFERASRWFLMLVMLGMIGVCIKILIRPEVRLPPLVLPLIKPMPTAPVPSVEPDAWNDKFDFARKDAEYDWCVQHDGVPSLTFTNPTTHSNVLCVRRTAVLALPKVLP